MNPYYAIALLISAAISFGITLIAWKRRTAPGAVGLMLFMLADAVWAATYAVRWMAAEPVDQLFWLDATYFGVAFHATFLMILALQFTGRSHLLTRRNLILSTIVPFITLLLLWTDQWHGLFFGGYHTTGSILNGGPWFWFFVIYSYTLIFIILGLFFQAFLRAIGLYRLQTGAILFGAFLPITGNILGLAGFSPFPNLDLTPFVFIISGLIYAYGLFGFHMMDVVPVARHKLVDEMKDGVIVLDANKRIVDINPAVQRLIGVSTRAIGRSSIEILNTHMHLDQVWDLKTSSLIDVRVSEDPPRDIELQISPLFDKHQKISGHLLILHEITERKQMEDEKEKVNIRLRTLSAAIEQSPVTTVITDLSGNIVFVNPRFTETTGYTADEAIGNNSRILKTDFKTSSEYKELWDTLLSGQSWRGIFHNKKKNGELYWESAAISPVKDEQGTVTHFLAVKEDITERKIAEGELHRAQDALEAAHRELQQSFAREQQLARMDDQTGINNHRSLMQLAEREFNVAMRYQQPFSMMFFDVDHFKQVNDTFGHEMGDQALKMTIKTVCACLRSADLIGRYGGDEFVILLPHTGAKEALPLAERIHASIAEMHLDTEKGPLTLTISIGIAQSVHGASQPDTVESLLLRADQALYAAKQGGRNRTNVFGQDSSEAV